VNDTDKKREQLKALYPGDKWAHKVEHMSESQVIAVYLAMKRQNKL
jgi:hypothetical protein